MPKARARVNRHGAYTPARTSEYENRVALFVRRHIKAPLAGKIRLTCTFFLPDARRRDLDNLIKSVLDGLNGVAWEDDSQVVEVMARKEIARNHPRTDISIEEDIP